MSWKRLMSQILFNAWKFRVRRCLMGNSSLSKHMQQVAFGVENSAVTHYALFSAELGVLTGRLTTKLLDASHFQTTVTATLQFIPLHKKTTPAKRSLATIALTWYTLIEIGMRPFMVVYANFIWLWKISEHRVAETRPKRCLCRLHLHRHTKRNWLPTLRYIAQNVVWRICGAAHWLVVPRSSCAHWRANQSAVSEHLLVRCQATLQQRDNTLTLLLVMRLRK